MSSIFLITFMISIGVVVIAIIIKNIFFSSKLESVSKLMDAGKYNDAVKGLKFIINKNASDPRAHFLLGECYYNVNNFEWAMPEYKQVLKLNSFTNDVSEHIVRGRLANIYLHYNKLEEAQKEFLLMSKLQPNNFMNYYQIGKIFFDRGYLDNAYKFVRKALQINPKHIDSLFKCGEISYQQKRYNDALVEMQEVLVENPQFMKAHYILGMVYYYNKNYGQAIREFDVSSRDPEYKILSLTQKGRSLYESGNVQSAITELERAKRLIKTEDSTALAIRYYLSICYEDLRQLDKAIELWEQISKIRSDYMDVQEKLATYEDLRTDDKIKDLLIASLDDYKRLCKLIIKFLGFNTLEMSSKRDDIVDAVVTEAESKWRNTRKIKRYIRIVRTNDIVGDGIIREVLDYMRDNGCNKSMVIVASKFSRQAMDYANTRPIDLIDKSGLSKLLRKTETITLDPEEEEIGK